MRNGFGNNIKLFIGFVFAIVVLVTIFNGYHALNGNNEYSFGLNGVTELRCIGGYKFVINQDGTLRQVLSEFGKGVSC